MTEVTKVKTSNKYEELASYSRLVAIDNLIFVSNTAGRNPQTKLIPEDVTEQTLQVFANIEAALASVDATLADVVATRIFVPNPQDIDAVGSVLGEKFHGIDPTLTMTCPPLGKPEFKVEIEVTAYRGASKAKPKHINLSR